MLSKLCVRAVEKNQNEDNIYVFETDESIVGCISDGCSTGTNSAFASQLLCYLFKKYIIISPYIEIPVIVRHIIRDLEQIAEKLEIVPMNLLATFMPFVYLKKEKNLRLMVFGDGFYRVNGVDYNVDQNNTPDYLGYHIYDSYADFEVFESKYPERRYEDVDSFIITSDGIDSIHASQFGDSDINPRNFLLLPPNTSNILERRYNILRKNKFINKDDLSIISYVRD